MTTSSIYFNIQQSTQLFKLFKLFKKPKENARCDGIIYVKIIIIIYFFWYMHKVHIHEISDEISPRINRYLMLFKMR